MVITNYNFDAMRDVAIADVATDFTYGAVGSGTTTPASTQTALVSETIRKAWQTTSGPTNGVHTFSLRLATTEANSTNLEEIGIFDAASSGNMGSRSLLTSYAKTSSAEVWIDVEVTVSAENFTCVLG